jgi:hypothetical protein
MDPLYATRHGLVRASDRIVSLSAWRRQDQKDKARRCRSKEVLVGSIEAKPRDLRKPDDESEGLRPPLRAGRRPRLPAAFRDGKVFQKGAHFPENVILPNMMINKGLSK